MSAVQRAVRLLVYTTRDANANTNKGTKPKVSTNAQGTNGEHLNFLLKNNKVELSHGGSGNVVVGGSYEHSKVKDNSTNETAEQTTEKALNVSSANVKSTESESNLSDTSTKSISAGVDFGGEVGVGTVIKWNWGIKISINKTE